MSDTAKGVSNQAGSLCCKDILLFAELLTSDNQKQERGACTLAGYRSVAIVPIRFQWNTAGLIHLAEKFQSCHVCG